MNLTIRILKYTLIAMAVLLLGSLSGWYVYLQTQKNPLAPATDTASESRGFQGNRGNLSVGAQGSDATSTSSEQIAQKPIEKLWRVDQGPVAGFSFVSPTPSALSASSSPPLLFAERASGYIFEADTSAQTTSRMTNTLIPQTYEAHFADRGDFVFLRSVDESGTITTLAAPLLQKDATTTPYALAGLYLPANIEDVALDDAHTSIFILSRDSAGGGAVGIVQHFDGSQPKQVFTSFIRSWRPLFAAGQLTLLTKPADDLPGYAYKVDAAGALSLLVGPVPGLSILPHPTDSALLYSSSSGGQLTLFVQTGKTSARAVQLQTVADKCVWAPGKSLTVYCAVPASITSSHFLDEWYRGALHTEDAWWKIDAASGEAEIMYTPTQSLDVQNPTIDATGTYIAFANGLDQSLWMLRIVQ